MMELVYLWVEEYKNIKNQGFNFSPRFTCKYENNELTIEEKKDYISIFPENINITAIVGENGSGKSSIGGVFVTKKFINCNKNISKCIFVVNYNNNLYAYNDTNVSLQFEHKTFDSLEEFKKDYEIFKNWSDQSHNDLSDKLRKEYTFLQDAKKPFIGHIYIKNSDENLFIAGKNIFTILSEFSSRDNHITGNTYRAIRPLERGDINNFEKLVGNIEILKFFIEQIGFEHKVNTYKHETKFNIGNKDIKFGELSFGEKYIIHTLCSLYFRIKNNKESIIFLDEVTLSMHPSLEKMFINLLIATVNKAQKDTTSNIKVHFIITSHSPFILSDLPKEHVIFLKKGKSNEVNINTFGANIHTLLSHGFFMKDGLMGEFAKEKISQILFLLSSKIGPINIHYEQIKPIIKLIGEDFLREKLLRMYEDKFSISKEEKIKQLEDELKKLKHG